MLTRMSPHGSSPLTRTTRCNRGRAEPMTAPCRHDAVQGGQAHGCSWGRNSRSRASPSAIPQATRQYRPNVRRYDLRRLDIGRRHLPMGSVSRFLSPHTGQFLIDHLGLVACPSVFRKRFPLAVFIRKTALTDPPRIIFALVLTKYFFNPFVYFVVHCSSLLTKGLPSLVRWRRLQRSERNRRTLLQRSPP